MVGDDSFKTLSAAPDSGSSPPLKRPQIGDVVADKFRLERLLGRGGMGFVMAARHIELDELFAIKFIESRADSDVIAAGRFYREARATLRMKNEHVVRVFDASAGQGDSMPYIIMEYLSGSDLAAVLTRSGPFPITQAVDYVLQACEAIAEAHALGIVHRDLKPSNIVLTTGAGDTPVIKVLDFGISTGPSDKTEVDFTLTETGAVFGSAAYMSPEQLRSTKHVDHRTDVWSLGVVLYELVTGHAPFDAASSVALSIAIVMDDPAPLRELRPDAPAELERIVHACLQKERDARVQSVAELATCLRPLASPLGLASCDVIERIATVGPPVSIPSGGVPSARPSTPLLSFGKTEPQIPPAQITQSSRRSTTALVGAFVAVALLSALLATRLGAPRAATELPSTAATSPAPLAAEALQPPAVTTSTAPAATPSAAAAASAKPAAGRPHAAPPPAKAAGTQAAAGRVAPTPPVALGIASAVPSAAPSNRPAPSGADPDLGLRF